MAPFFRKFINCLLKHCEPNLSNKLQFNYTWEYDYRHNRTNMITDRIGRHLLINW